MANQTRRTRRERNEQIPQRVENAAQNMYASSGMQRGYIPGGYAQTGTAQQQNGWGQAAQQPMGQQSGAQMPYQQRYDYQQAYGQQSQMTGAQRGFRMQMTPPPEQKRKQKKKGHAIAVISVLLVLAALGTGGYFAAKNYLHSKTINEKVEPYDNLFCPGIYVDGIHLGGMTPQQAMNSVQSQIQQRHDAWKVQLTWNGSVVAEIDSDMLGFNVDPAQVMNEAWKQGHTGDKEQRYEQMLQLEQTPYVAYTAKPDGNTGIIDTKLSEIKSAIDKPATDAVMTGFDPSLDYPFTFTDEAYGMQLNIEPIKERLYQMVSTLESGTVELQPERLEPSVHKADLMKHYMLRSSVYTPIDKHSTDERNMNIQHAFDFVNGYVLQPGKTFSFNGVVGERTEARGFYPAIEYVYGEHVEGFGGGVCQASTTIYQAALCAGLQIVERRPHSEKVKYTELGLDATVYLEKGSKHNKDFRFKNNTDGDIYIFATVEKDPAKKGKKYLRTRVDIYGPYMGDVHYELKSNIVETIDPGVEIKKDRKHEYTSYPGEQYLYSEGREGYKVEVYRVNTVNGQSEYLYTDTYEPKKAVYYEGV